MCLLTCCTESLTEGPPDRKAPALPVEGVGATLASGVALLTGAVTGAANGWAGVVESSGFEANADSVRGVSDKGVPAASLSAQACLRPPSFWSSTVVAAGSGEGADAGSSAWLTTVC